MLPPEILRYILYLCDPVTFCRATMVCKQWYELPSDFVRHEKFKQHRERNAVSLPKDWCSIVFFKMPVIISHWMLPKNNWDVKYEKVGECGISFIQRDSLDFYFSVFTYGIKLREGCRKIVIFKLFDGIVSKPQCIFVNCRENGRVFQSNAAVSKKGEVTLYNILGFPSEFEVDVFRLKFEAPINSAPVYVS
jgi:hypothetical protein